MPADDGPSFTIVARRVRAWIETDFLWPCFGWTFRRPPRAGVD